MFWSLKSCVMFLMIFTLNPCFSQDSISFRKESSNIKISYNSTLIYPGARLGIEDTA